MTCCFFSFFKYRKKLMSTIIDLHPSQWKLKPSTAIAKTSAITKPSKIAAKSKKPLMSIAVIGLGAAAAISVKKLSSANHKAGYDTGEDGQLTPP